MRTVDTLNTVLEHGDQASDLDLIERPTSVLFKISLDCVNVFERGCRMLGQSWDSRNGRTSGCAWAIDKGVRLPDRWGWRWGWLGLLDSRLEHAVSRLLETSYRHQTVHLRG